MVSYPNCDFSLQDVRTVTARILDALHGRRPLSFVRIGDGEGLLLSLSERSTGEDLLHFNRYFGDSAMGLEELLLLRGEVRQAFECADLIGIRDDVLSVAVDPGWLSLREPDLADKVKRHFRLRPVEKDLPPFGCRRLALTNHALAHMEFRADTTFTSAWAHWDLLASGALYRLLSEQRRVGVITSRRSLPRLMEEIFSLTAAAYFVPDRSVMPPGVSAGAHFPRRFAALREELRVEFPGMLFLVGAGPCGRVYCRWIRERGGVALDLGAVMDAWVGIASRPAVMAHRFPSWPRQGGVPPELLLNRESVDRLAARYEADAAGS